MAGVFISHASADKLIVDPFVDDVIRLGCGVPPEEIFYSSGEDTGVPSREDLNTYVRDEVADADIVVAIISPAFQMRPFCIAELGAAWSKVGNLFPIAVPDMERTDLEGVLKGVIVKHLDDGSALDELHVRIGKALGHSSGTDTWGRYRAKWLANVDSFADQLPPLRVVSPHDLDRLETDLAGTQAALRESEAERRTLEDQVERLAAVKSADEVADILLPEDEIERFEHLAVEAKAAVGKLDWIVAEAMWYDLFDGGMPWPNRFDEATRAERSDAARRDGTLIENSSDLLVPDEDVKEIAAAYEAVHRLQELLGGDTTERFDNWFREKYGASHDLRKKRVWDALLESRPWV